MDWSLANRGRGRLFAPTHVANPLLVLLFRGSPKTTRCFLELQRHILRESSRCDWQVLPTEISVPGDNDGVGRSPVDAAKKLVQCGVSGVILIPHQVDNVTGKWNESMLNVFRSAKIPVVLLDRDYLEPPHRSQFDLVSLDNTRAGFELGCHLLERGRKKIAYVGNPKTYSSIYGRLAGLRKALALEVLELPEGSIFSTSQEEFQRIIQRVKTGKIDAVVCNSDQDAALFMRECFEARIRIPDEVALAGFDDQPIARLLGVPLTTVSQPAQALAICTISTLRDRINFPSLPPRTLRVQGELIIRDST